MIQAERGGIYVKFGSQPNAADFLDAVQAVNALPNFETIRYVINDFSESVVLVSPDPYLEAAAAAGIGANVTNPRLLTAFVVGSLIVLQAFATYFDLADGAFTAAVFDNLEQARHWVGLVR